jgi:hypothetical protein
MIKTFVAEKTLKVKVFVNKFYSNNFGRDGYIDLYFSKHINKVKVRTTPEATFKDNFFNKEENLWFLRWTLGDIDLKKNLVYEYDAEIVDYGILYSKLQLLSSFEGAFCEELCNLAVDGNKAQTNNTLKKNLDINYKIFF